MRIYYAGGNPQIEQLLFAARNDFQIIFSENGLQELCEQIEPPALPPTLLFERMPMSSEDALHLIKQRHTSLTDAAFTPKRTKKKIKSKHFKKR